MLMQAELALQNPITAVTHPDPYPYYRQLLAEHPLAYDTSINIWVAASAEAVRAVLTSPLCRVRPVNEPVPAALVGSPLADIFGRLVRMNDGAHHQPFKQAISHSLGSLDLTQVGRLSGQWASHLSDERRPHECVEGLTAYTFQLSAYVIGSLLGIPDKHLTQTAHWIDQYIAAVAPSASPQAIEQGKSAASHLLEQFHKLLTDHPASGLVTALATQAHRVGRPDTAVIAANAIGFLSQAYEATAGLIGSTLLKLERDPELYTQITAYPDLLNAVVQEVLRWDSPVQNTRRFVAQNGIVAGQPMQAGQMVLVLLAAANHDPLANPHPHHFDLFRKNRQLFTFGIGAHACPGAILASSIATAGVMQLLEAGLQPERLTARVHYRPSANTRIPLFD